MRNARHRIGEIGEAARGTRKNVPYKEGEIDFLVIYVHPEQTFYILSQKSLAGRVALSVPSTRRKSLGPFAQHHERWDLLTGKKPFLPNKKSLHKRPRRSKFLTIHASAGPAYDVEGAGSPCSVGAPARVVLSATTGETPISRTFIFSLSS